jgi:uncharacterized protein (TIGR02118 family)
MVKVLVMYNQPINQEGFEHYYQNVHIPLAKRIPNLTSLEIHRVLQTQHTISKLYLVAELGFEDQQKLKEGMDSPEGKEAQEDVLNLMPFLGNPPVIITVD